eukprot:scaffold451_cov184-Amphora_coffeaeformis.AAC.15
MEAFLRRHKRGWTLLLLLQLLLLSRNVSGAFAPTSSLTTSMTPTPTADMHNYHHRHDLSLLLMATTDEENEKARSSYFATPIVKTPQEYFKDRIQAARQRALLASMKDEQGSTALKVLTTPKKSSPAPPPTPAPMDAASVAARQEYFKDRIQAARQRALLANIVETKAAGNQLTTATLRGNSKTPTSVSLQVSPRIAEQRQRALLATQLALNSPAARALRQRQQYFRNRIESSRQRALLANIVESTQTGASGDNKSARKTTMATLSSQKAKATPPKEITPTPLTPEKVARQQEYFRDRIQAARQRVLLANIASTKAAGNQLTTATLKKPAAVVAISAERRQEQFQRALLAAQLAQTPVVRQQRQRQAYFQTRIRSTRQRDLLESISSTKAAGDKLTTASFSKRKYDSSPAVQLPTNKQQRKEARLANREARRQATREQIASMMVSEKVVPTDAASSSNQPKKFSPLKGNPSSGKVRPGTTPLQMRQPQQSTTGSPVSSSSSSTAASEPTEQQQPEQQSHQLTNDDMMKKEKYGKIKSVGERAYIILKDLGMI